MVEDDCDIIDTELVPWLLTDDPAGDVMLANEVDVADEAELVGVVEIADEEELGWLRPGILYISADVTRRVLVTASNDPGALKLIDALDFSSLVEVKIVDKV